MRTLIIALSILIPSLAFSQGRPGEDKVEASKIVFITQKLNLTAEDSKTFWPIYNDYQRETRELRKARMQKMISFKKVTEIDDLSDSEIQNLIVSDFDYRQKDLNIEKKYYAKLKSSGLSIKLIGKFYRAQEAFKKELLRNYRGGQNRQ